MKNRIILTRDDEVVVCRPITDEEALTVEIFVTENVVSESKKKDIVDQIRKNSILRR